MEIIKRGNPQDAGLPATCTGKGNSKIGCGTEVKLHPDDVYQTSSSALSETDYFRTWMCPVCGSWNDLESYSGFPKGINSSRLPPYPDKLLPEKRAQFDRERRACEA